jgi:hypothetical protein
MLRAFVVICCVILSTPAAWARTWTSSKGDYTFEGDIVAINSSTVILKRARAERLVVVDIADLSAADQELLAEKQRELAATDTADTDGWQTWTSIKGWQIRGRVQAFGRRELVIERSRGAVAVNGKAFSTLDALHQRLLLAALSQLENQTFENERDLSRWVMTLGGVPKSYQLEGVLMQLEGGETLPVPFFLFSKDDLQILQPGWESWQAAEDDKTLREREDLLVRQEALQYQAMQQRAMKHEQMEVLKLNLLAAGTGLTSIWEVALFPAPGTWGRPTTVVVSARDSLSATQMAVNQHPGYVAGPVRKVAGR